MSDFWIEANWPAPTHIHAGTTTRLYGNSMGSYKGLNLAMHVNDAVDTVQQNRKLLTENLNLKTEPYWLQQVHGNNIICLDDLKQYTPHIADGSVTTAPNKVCVVLTADCVPILITDKDGSKIAAIHAGWRGICRGIIDNACQHYNNLSDLLVWIGPSISAEQYEVGKNVVDSCIKYQTLTKDAFLQTDENHWLCDLPLMAEHIFISKGVKKIFQSKLCTYSDATSFYSYRRDGETGRTASMIWIE